MKVKDRLDQDCRPLPHIQREFFELIDSLPNAAGQKADLKGPPKKQCRKKSRETRPEPIFFFGNTAAEARAAGAKAAGAKAAEAVGASTDVLIREKFSTKPCCRVRLLQLKSPGRDKEKEKKK